MAPADSPRRPSLAGAARYRVESEIPIKMEFLIFTGGTAMARAGRAGCVLVVGAIAFSAMAAPASAQQTQYPKPTDLPNPYRLVEGWPTLPKTMNGGKWGEVIRVHVAHDGNIWVFHRCFNTVPPGSAVCINRGPANPPILEFDPAGRLLKSFGAGLFAYPHGFTLHQDGNLWSPDVNEAERGSEL